MLRWIRPRRQLIAEVNNSEAAAEAAKAWVAHWKARALGAEADVKKYRAEACHQNDLAAEVASRLIVRRRQILALEADIAELKARLQSETEDG